MRSLEKDRSRRYESAAALAGDLRRYLNEEPVEARPPSRSYLARKFAARNRVAIITASLVTIAMIVGTTVSLWQASLAITERNQKEQALQEAVEAKNQAEQARREVEAFAQRMASSNMLVASAETHANAGRWSSANYDYTTATELQPNYFLPWVQRGQMYVRLKLWNRAADDYARAVALGGASDAPQWWGVPALFLLTGATEEYRSVRDQQLRQIDSSAPAWNAVRTAVISSREPAVLSFAGLAELTRQWSEIQPEHPRSSRVRHPRREAETRPRPEPRDDEFPPSDADRRDAGPRDLGPLRFGPGPPVPVRSDRGHRPQRQFPLSRQGPPRDQRVGMHDGHQPRGVKDYITGLAELRANHFSTAIDRLQMASKDRGWAGRQLTLPALAIALQGDGRSEQAEKALQVAKAEMDRLMEAIAGDPEGPLPMPWFDFIEAQVLLNEASNAITFATIEPDPRWELIREHSIDLLNTP